MHGAPYAPMPLDALTTFNAVEQTHFDRIVEPALDLAKPIDEETRKGCKIFVSGIDESLGDDVAAQDAALRIFFSEAGGPCREILSTF